MKRNETKFFNTLIKNGKYFLLPPKDSRDFKELFKEISAAGAGRPADGEGFPAGPWTPELLADAISRIDGNRGGIDLRTVQIWFQDNEKGISAENIRWLARVLGCDDPVATSEWQRTLSEAQSRLKAKRRRERTEPERETPAGPDAVSQVQSDDRKPLPEDSQMPTGAPRTSRNRNLAQRVEAYFSSRSPLDLSCFVFAGAVALGFLSFMFQISGVRYITPDQLEKQVGYLWAPNWTIVFLVILPLFLMIVGDILIFWKNEVRQRLAGPEQDSRSDGWQATVGRFSQSYWTAFAVCLPIAFLLQWVDVCLIPLLSADPGTYAVDWGKIALVMPELLTVPEAIAFTGLAYFYMGICFFLYYSGLILLYTVSYDLWRIGRSSAARADPDHLGLNRETCRKLVRSTFRCAALGLLIALCMKLQSVYMLSASPDIIDWIRGDLRSLIEPVGNQGGRFEYRMPSLYSSLLIALPAIAVFIFACGRCRDVIRAEARPEDALLQQPQPNRPPHPLMTVALAMLSLSYVTIGAFDGFSIVLLLAVLVSVYAVLDPECELSIALHRTGQNVS